MDCLCNDRNALLYFVHGLCHGSWTSWIVELHISDCGMTVKRISLMKSERGKKGMIYTEIGGVDCEPE